MAPRITYGASGGDFADETRKAEAYQATLEQVDQKEREVAAAEERGQATEAGLAKSRTGLTDATEAMSAALKENIGALSAETAALRLNSAELERQLTLRRQLASSGGRGGGGGVLPPVAFASGGPEEDPVARAQAAAARERQVAQRGSLASAFVPVGGAGSPAERAAQFRATTQDPATLREGERYYENVAKNENALRNMGAAQAASNTEFQSAAAAYASSSNALSRHGALTTEFISALARGQVTMREFGSQMQATIGKFGGWIAAGAAVYGVVKLFGDLTKGATETQTAVEQMGRFIPGLGGPAGGGRGQIAPFEDQLRSISTEFNVPISEVSTSMMVMARSFHTVTDAANATRAALAIQRLDLVPPTQTEQYLIGIANSMGFTGHQGGGSGLIGVVNQLNEIQSQYGARVAQVLPGLARAAPAALASGTNLNQLEALTALGVRAGLPGNQVGTALLRSMTGFAFRPASEVTYGRFGINAIPGEYGNLIEQIMGTISARAQSGHPLGRTDLTQLASALGGPQLGGRSILPLLVQQSEHPGENLYQNVLNATRHPRPYQQDLSQVLDTVGERFKSIGITLQNFGSQLAESGALQPLITILTVFKDLASAVESVLSPFSRVLGLFNVLPGFLQNIAGAAAIFAAARWASTSTRFGGAATAAISRLPGLGGLYSNSRGEVEGYVGRLQTYVQPLQQQELDSARAARLRAAGTLDASLIALNQHGPGLKAAADQGGTAGAEAEATLTGLRKTVEGNERALAEAKQREEAASAANAQTEADIVVLKNKQLSWSERAAYMEQRGAYASEELANIKQQLVDQAMAQFRAGDFATAAAAARVSGVAGVTGGGIFMSAADTTRARAFAQSIASDPAVSGAGIAAAGVATAAAAGAAARRFARGATPISDAPTSRLFYAGAATDTPGTYNEFGGLVSEEAAAASARSRLASISARVRGAVPDFLRGPGLPLAGTLLASALPQGSLSTGLQSGFSDALIASFIKPGNLALGAGAFGLGLATSPTSPGLAGTLQHVAGGALAGGFLAKAVAPKLAPLIARGITSAGEALGLELAPETGGISLALTAGSAIIGGLLGGVLGPTSTPAPPQPSAWGVNADAQSALHAVLYGGRAGRNAFGSNVSGMLADAYLGTGAQAQRGQQSASAIVNTLTAQLGLFGSSSPEGQAAQQGISEFMGSAAEYARQNPQVTQQLMQTFTQASNAEVQRRFQFALSQGGPGSGASAASAAAAQTQAMTVQPLQTALSDQGDILAARQQTLAQYQAQAARASGDQKGHLEKQVAAQRNWVNQSQSNIQTLTAMTGLARDNASLQEQQYAQQALQADQASIQAATQLAVARAGGSQVGQLQATLAGAQKSLQTVQNSSLTGRARTDALNQAQAAVLQAHSQIVTQGLNTVQATGAVAEASTPLGDQAAEARQKAQDAYNAWQYMVKNRHAFDPNQIKEAWANVLSARRDAIQAASDQATQLNDLRTQIAAAQDYGDPVGQAQINLQGAYRDLSLARTPQARLQAQANIAQQQEALNQAQQQHYSDLGNLWASALPGDPVGQAAAMVQAAQLQLANAHGTENIITAQTALNNANAAYYDAVTQQVDTYYQTDQINATGNAALQAAYARAQAAYDTARARGPGEAAKAAQERAQAAQQTYQAEQTTTQERTALAVARDVYNPIEAARRNIRGIDAQLRRARRENRPDDVRQLEAQRAQAEYQLHQARIARITQRGATREARQSGNTVAAAHTAVDTARAVLDQARGTQEQQAAEAQLATAEHQLSQARIARAQALAQIGETRDTGNVVAQAQDAVRAAAREAELAKGRDAHIKARQDEATAHQQEIAARQQRAQEYGQLAIAQAGDDPVAAAQAALRAAERQLQLAHGKDQKLVAEANYVNAQNALVSALNNEYIALGQLAAARDWTDPLRAIQDQINGVLQALAHATTPYQRIQYQTQLAGLRAQYQQTLVSQTQSTIQFQLDMHQITAQQAIAQLQSLLGSQKMTQQTRQQIEEQIRQLQLGGGTSEFNLAPGNIKLPTLFDVARAMGGTGHGAASPFGTGSVTATANSTIQVFVGNDADVAKVAAAIDNATGSQLAGALRAAGLSG